MITQNTKILNPHHWEDFIGVTRLAITNDSGRTVYHYLFGKGYFTPELFTRLDYSANGIAVWKSTVHISVQRTGQILLFNGEIQE